MGGGLTEAKGRKCFNKEGKSRRTVLPVGFSPKKVCSDLVRIVLEEWWVSALLQRLRRERERGGHGLSEQVG